MLTPITITLILNGLTLTLSLAMLILILWNDSRRTTNLYFAWFLLMVVIWSSGSLLSRGSAVAGAQHTYIENGLRWLELGFTSASLALYMYVGILIGNRSRVFQTFALLSIVTLLAYHALLSALNTTLTYNISSSGLLNYTLTDTSTLIFSLVNVITLITVWQSFRKVRRAAMAFGIMLFCLGQLVALLSTRLRELGVAEDTGGLATMIMAFSLVRSQIIQPLLGQTRQIGVVRDVGLVITSRLRLQNALKTIAEQAAALIGAEASIIFLRRDDPEEFVLAAQYNIRADLLNHRLSIRDGVTGKVAAERRSYLINDYRREWNGVPDTLSAKEDFGAVIGVPLTFADDVVGVLLVIAMPENRLFDPEDVRLLELLAPQAAVGITNSRLFEQERDLTNEVAKAKTQLEAVLASTDNPVLAVNKHLRVVFANKAAATLVADDAPDLRGQFLLDLMPRFYLPQNIRQLLKDLKAKRSHVYELELGEKTYLIHLTRMSQPDEGWVAVLNEVTSLKELDRMQRQMMEFTTHQLKNPLQGAMLHLDLHLDDLEDLGETVFTDEMRSDIRVINEQLERMERLIKGMLNLERLMSNKDAPRFEQVDFRETVVSVVNDLRPLAQNKTLQLRLKIEETLPLVVGNPQQLKEAVTCLVDNALKYTPAQGCIDVEARQQDGTVVLKVQDNGIGIPKDLQGYVFDRFYRVEQSGTEQVGGSGLGLSLVKTIVESHRGRIWLESEAGEGTTFFVALPGL